MLIRASCLLVLAGSAALGQAPADPYRASVAAMESSIAQQRESVARQLSVVSPSSEGYFLTGWPMGSSAIARLPITSSERVNASDCAPIPPSELQGYIDDVSQREGLSPDLLRAVIQRESAFYPCAVSRKGAQGLMQIMPETGVDLGLTDPFDPWENIDAGARFLGQLLSRYGGDVSLALGAYNAGPELIEQYQGLPPIPETLDYVADILDSMRISPLETQPGTSSQVIPWEPASLNLSGQ